MNIIPPLPCNCTREEAIESLIEVRNEYYRLRRLGEPGFVRHPDFDRLLDYIEEYGLPPKE